MVNQIQYTDDHLIPMQSKEFEHAIYSYIKEMVFSKYRKKRIEDKVNLLKDEIKKDSNLNQTTKLEYLFLIDKQFKKFYNQILNDFNLDRAVKDVLEIIDS